MTEQAAETPAEAPQEDRIDTLEKKVDQILGMLSGGSGTNPSTNPEPVPADPKAEMRNELAKLQRAENAKKARQAEKDRLDGRLKQIEDKISEKPPEEYSRLTNFFGWRDKPKEKQA